jgi:SPP1 family predicted phage head-tail adaptor
MIQIIKKVPGQDDYGEPLDDWEVHKTVWASKNPILGNEFYTALTTDSKVELKFNMRYVPDITDLMRIRHGNEDYEILSCIDVNSLHIETLCYCKLVK